MRYVKKLTDRQCLKKLVYVTLGSTHHGKDSSLMM